MNAKKYLLAAIVLSAVVATFAASVRHHLKFETQSAVLPSAALSGPSGRFGPVIETMLPDPKNAEGPTEILNLETGRTMAEPRFSDLISPAEALIAWPRSHGLDISCFLSIGSAACVTYDMTILPVASKSWEHTTEEELLTNPALAPVNHAPRRLLSLGNNRPDTYIFRTGEGTLGMLRIVGLSRQGPGVIIRYKLINPAKSFVARRLSQS